MHGVADWRCRLKPEREDYGEALAVGQQRLLQASATSVDKNDAGTDFRRIPVEPVNAENRIVRFNLPDRPNRYP
ncbi:MAG TPA: hypothetical protein DCE47_23190 [Planctomycetaceae bacterium]|nr:hypothetical protein [Planctomycetaceae bacterium]